MRISDWSSDVCSSDLSAKLAAFQVSVAVVDGLPEHLQRTLAEASNRARQMRSSRMAVREDRALACAAAMATAAERVSTHVAAAAERAEIGRGSGGARGVQ